MTGTYRFAAFISYSSRDAAFAKRLHGALERYHIPTQLGAFELARGGRKNRIYPVFRDRDELPSGDLGAVIRAALEESSALVVVCSPNAAASPWVNKEIETFLEFGRRDRIFAVIANDAPLNDEAGADAPQTSFPPAFRRSGLGDQFEPLAADARPGKDGFRTAWLKVVAGLIGVNAGSLIDRDRKRRRQRALAGGVVASVVAAAAALTAGQLDAIAWRDALTTVALEAASEGRTVDSLPVAVAGVAHPGALLGGEGSRADETLRAAGKARLVHDFGRLEALDFSKDGRFMFAQGADRNAAIYDLQDGMKRTDLGEIAEARSIKFSPDGRELFIQTVDFNTVYFDLAAGPQRNTLGNLGMLNAYAMSKDGKVLVVSAADQVLRIYPLAPGALPSVVGRPGGFYGVSLLSENGVIVTLGNRNHPVLYDLSAGVRPLDLGLNRDMRLSDDGGTLLVLRNDLTAVAYDLSDHARKTELGRVGPLRDFTISGNGRWLYTHVEDFTGAVFDLRSGARTGLGNVGVTRDFSMSSLGKYLVTRSGEGVGTLYDVEAGGRKTDLGPIDMRRLSFSADNETLFTRGADGQGVVRWLKTGRRKDLGQLGATKQVLLSDDGKVLVSFGADHGATLFHLDGNAQPIVLGDLGETRYQWMSADGATLLTQAADFSTVLYDLRAQAWAGKAPSGERLAAAVCDASGGAMRPLSSKARNLPAIRSLAGRPWNPCDWRGLGAVFPDKVRGDGAFEGLKQWWRRVQVVQFGRADLDYGCAETTSAASQVTQNARTRMCSMYEPRR